MIQDAIERMDRVASIPDEWTEGSAEEQLSLLYVIRVLKERDGVLSRLERVLEDALYDTLGPARHNDLGVEVKREGTRSGWDHTEVQRAVVRYAERRESGVLANEDGEPHPPAVIAGRAIEVYRSVLSSPTYRVGTADGGPGLRTTLGLDLEDVCSTSWRNRVLFIKRREDAA